MYPRLRMTLALAPQNHRTRIKLISVCRRQPKPPLFPQGKQPHSMCWLGFSQQFPGKKPCGVFRSNSTLVATLSPSPSGFLMANTLQEQDLILCPRVKLTAASGYPGHIVWDQLSQAGQVALALPWANPTPVHSLLWVLWQEVRASPLHRWDLLDCPNCLLKTFVRYKWHGAGRDTINTWCLCFAKMILKVNGWKILKQIQSFTLCFFFLRG